MDLPCNYCDKVFQIESQLVAHEYEHELLELQDLADAIMAEESTNGFKTDQRPRASETGLSTPVQNLEESDVQKVTNVLSEPEVEQLLASIENSSIATEDVPEPELEPDPELETPSESEQRKENPIEVFFFDSGKEQQTSDEFECSVCFKIFSSEKSLAVHGQRIHGKQLKEACINQSESSTPSPAKSSEPSQGTPLEKDGLPDFSKNGKFPCEFCGKCFTRKADKSRHERTVHHDSRPFQCPVCPSKFKEKGHLNKHKQWHYRSAEFACRLCGELFPTKRSLLSHQAKEHDSKDCACKFCGQSLSGKDIVEHYETKHPQEYDSETRECPICDDTLENKNEYIEHLQEHRQQHNRICEFCGQIYADHSTLKRHIATVHEKEARKHPCLICDKECYSASRLEEHLRLHTGEKPYQCDTCSKTFKSLRSARDHQRMHTGEKPFVCEVCDKGFTHREGWKYHMRHSHGIDPCKKRKVSETSVVTVISFVPAAV